MGKFSKNFLIFIVRLRKIESLEPRFRFFGGGGPCGKLRFHFPWKYEFFVNNSRSFARFTEMGKKEHKKIDGFLQYPLNSDKGYWRKLSKKKMAASRTSACGHFLDCLGRGACDLSHSESKQSRFAIGFF